MNEFEETMDAEHAERQEQQNRWQQAHLREEAWLAGLKAGDVVCIRSGFHNTPSRHTVTKTTPTQIHVGSTKYRRRDGRRMGESSYYTGRIEEMTPEIEAAAREVRMRNDLYGRLEKAHRNYKQLPMEQVEALLAILPPVEK